MCLVAELNQLTFPKSRQLQPFDLGNYFVQLVDSCSAPSTISFTVVAVDLTACVATCVERSKCKRPAQVEELDLRFSATLPNQLSHDQSEEPLLLTFR